MIAVGLVGTSWWSDRMFLPALKDHPDGKIVAICGRSRDHTQHIADQWQIPHVHTDYNAMIASGQIQAIIISTPNDLHYPITMKALEAGLHVLCEKPIGMNYGEAKRMAELAGQKSVRHLVPFTWSYMPTIRYVKELLDGGYIGKPYHLNMRWYNEFWRGSPYSWRMDKAKAGSGVISELGSHYVYIAYQLFGGISSVSCQLATLGQHPTLDAGGKPFEQADDTAVLTLQFENGAEGSIYLSGIAHKELPQAVECLGSEGSLSSVFGFDVGQHVFGAKAGEGALRELPIPNHIWGGVGHENLNETFEDMFWKQDFMTRQFISSIAANKPVKPDFEDGVYVQRVIDAALKSHHERRWVDVADIR